jgi:hypothetical protein
MAASLMLAACPAWAQADPRLPIIDMHLHARKADYMGSNPPPMCAPFEVMPRWDNSLPGEEGFTFHSMPPCKTPIPPATSDQSVMDETIAVMQSQKRDILYNNAARFLRLSEETISRHHRM